MHSIKIFMLILFIGRGLFAFVIGTPKNNDLYHTKNGKPRFMRDIGAATWPHFDEMELAIITRSPRNSKVQEDEATVLIADFWRNFGKSAEELEVQDESESEVVDNQIIVEQTKDKDTQEEVPGSQISDTNNEDVQSTSEEAASFRFSITGEPYAHAISGKEESQLPQQNPSPQQTQSPSISTLYPEYNRNHQQPGYLPLYPNPPYSGPPVPLPQSFGIGTPYAAGNAYTAQNAYTPVNYNQMNQSYNPFQGIYRSYNGLPLSSVPTTQQSYPSNIPYQGIYGSYHNGFPLSSITPHIPRKLPMDTNSEHGSVYSQPPMLSRGGSYPLNTQYLKFPANPSVPQPSYSFVPFNPIDVKNTPVSSYQTQRTNQNPNIIVQNGPPSVPVPNYPYSSANF